MITDLRPAEIKCLAQLDLKRWRYAAKFGRGGPNAHVLFRLAQVGLVESTTIDTDRIGTTVYRLTEYGAQHLNGGDDVGLALE